MTLSDLIQLEPSVPVLSGDDLLGVDEPPECVVERHSSVFDARVIRGYDAGVPNDEILERISHWPAIRADLHPAVQTILCEGEDLFLKSHHGVDIFLLLTFMAQNMPPQTMTSIKRMMISAREILFQTGYVQ